MQLTARQLTDKRITDRRITGRQITGREATRRIVDSHLLSERQARRVLAAGLAGIPERRPSALLYDESQVEALIERPRCTDAALEKWRPFIGRLGRERAFSLDETYEAQIAAVATGWRLPLMASLWIDARGPLAAGRYPFLATLGGWVVLGAEIAGQFHKPDQASLAQETVQLRDGRTGGFELQPPGDWFDDFRHTWLPLENGATWTLWGMPTETAGPDSLSADFIDQEERRRTEQATTGTAALRHAAQVWTTEQRGRGG